VLSCQFLLLVQGQYEDPAGQEDYVFSRGFVGGFTAHGATASVSRWDRHAAGICRGRNRHLGSARILDVDGSDGDVDAFARIARIPCPSPEADC